MKEEQVYITQAQPLYDAGIDADVSVSYIQPLDETWLKPLPDDDIAEQFDDDDDDIFDLKGYSNKYLDLEFLMESEIYDQWSNVKDKDWAKVWTGIDLKIDPCQAAADHYLLFGIANNLFVTITPKTFPTEAEIQAAGLVLGESEMAIIARITEIENERNADPAVQLAPLCDEANELYVQLVEKLDLSFREYVHLACGGELRHMLNGDMVYSAHRRRAWVQWFFVYDKYGHPALTQMSKAFRELGNSTYGGEKWATASDILLAREEGSLGPDEFTNKQLFVDRVFTLEHNNGTLLNKLPWANNRLERSEGSESYVMMQTTVLQAHCSNPVDIRTMYLRASSDVQSLVDIYLTQATKIGLEINGIWQQPTDEKDSASSKKTALTVNGTAVPLLDWSDVSDTTEEVKDATKPQSPHAVGESFINGCPVLAEQSEIEFWMEMDDKMFEALCTSIADDEWDENVSSYIIYVGDNYVELSFVEPVSKKFFKATKHVVLSTANLI